MAVLDAGFEPIFQQTCRDRNRLALQSDLLAAWTLGLENVLVVTGDAPRGGDHPQAKGVFDLDSTQLIAIATGMNEGHDMLGREIEGATDFYIGAAVFPEAQPWDVQLDRALAKVEAGASFFQTQAIFDIDMFAAGRRRPASQRRQDHRWCAASQEPARDRLHQQQARRV